MTNAIGDKLSDVRRAFRDADARYRQALTERTAAAEAVASREAELAREREAERFARWSDPTIEAELVQADQDLRDARAELDRVRRDLRVGYAQKARLDDLAIRAEYGPSSVVVGNAQLPGMDEIGTKVVDDPRWIAAAEVVRIAKVRRNRLRRQQQRSANHGEYAFSVAARESIQQARRSPLLQRMNVDPAELIRR